VEPLTDPALLFCAGTGVASEWSRVHALMQEALDRVAAEVGGADFTRIATSMFLKSDGLERTEELARARKLKISYEFGRAKGFHQATYSPPASEHPPGEAVVSTSHMRVPGLSP
jgi:hypothetical protein